MKFFLFTFFIQLLSSYEFAYGEIFRKDFEKKNQDIIWEKIETSEKSNSLKKVIWKSYKDDEDYFNQKVKIKKADKLKNSEKKYFDPRESKRSLITQIEPHIPLNYFLNKNNYLDILN